MLLSLYDSTCQISDEVTALATTLAHHCMDRRMKAVSGALICIPYTVSVLDSLVLEQKHRTIENKMSKA